MRIVTFARDMAPHVRGERRLVPDDVADRLVASGDAEPDPAPFPAPPAAPDGAGDDRARRRRYSTKEAS